MIFGRFHVKCNEENSVKRIVSDPMKKIFFPCFPKGNDWNKNELDKEKNRQACINSIQHFLLYVNGNCCFILKL